MKKVVLLAALAALVGCTVGGPVPEKPAPLPEAPKEVKEILEKRTVDLKSWGLLTLPKTGLLVQESHYVTPGDVVPTSGSDGMAKHLAASCELLRAKYDANLSKDCSEIYNANSKRVWTPAEGGGKIGANARATRVPLEQELFQGNMYWKKLPPAGEKWLVMNEAKKLCVVISMGNESGPNGTKFIGGVTTEVHFFLKASNSTPLLLAPLKDQTLPYGPLKCQ